MKKATVTELVIPKEKYDKVQKIMSSKVIWYKKKEKLKAAAGFNPFCCVCNGITSPLYEVRYSDPELVRLEIYCADHIETYHNTKNKTNLEIAQSYGLEIGEIDHTRPNPWD